MFMRRRGAQKCPSIIQLCEKSVWDKEHKKREYPSVQK